MNYSFPYLNYVMVASKGVGMADCTRQGAQEGAHTGVALHPQVSPERNVKTVLPIRNLCLA